LQDALHIGEKCRLRQQMVGKAVHLLLYGSKWETYDSSL
jgi:hypothetical protein